jgi:hypothetical protein
MAEVPTKETENTGPIRRARASLVTLKTLERLRQAPHTSPAARLSSPSRTPSLASRPRTQWTDVKAMRPLKATP